MHKNFVGAICAMKMDMKRPNPQRLEYMQANWQVYFYLQKPIWNVVLYLHMQLQSQSVWLMHLRF